MIRIYCGIATLVLILACTSNESQDANQPVMVVDVDAPSDGGPSAGGTSSSDGALSASACQAIMDEVVEWIFANDDCTVVTDCMSRTSLNLSCLRGSPNGTPADCSKSAALRTDADEAQLNEIDWQLQACYPADFQQFECSFCGMYPALDCVDGSCRVVDCQPGCGIQCNGRTCSCDCSDAATE